MTEPLKPRIVASDHLASGTLPELSEFEFGLIVAYNAFARWVQRCMAAAGQPELGVLEVLVLHHVNHRGRGKRLSDIAFLMNIEDLHTVNYALKKLVRLSLIASEKRGKEAFYTTTATGGDICSRYAEVRQMCLLQSMPGDGDAARTLSDAAALLRRLSGQYDQASRAAASL